MELRSLTHFHFVNAIKGGSVAKFMNVDFRGRPALKFKEIKEVYNLRDTKYHDQVPTVHLRDDLESSPTECNGVEVETTTFSLVREVKIKSEPEDCDLNCSNNGDERIGDLDDLSFVNMTLRQLKKSCKSKKRKCSNFVGLNKETMKICSSVEHELPNFSPEDDGYDLEEPLISLKSKLSKNMKKRKRKSSGNSVSVSSPNEVLLAPVKVEVPEPCYSKCGTMFGVKSVPRFSHSKQLNSTVTVSNDVPETANVHISETRVPYPTKEPQYDSLNEVSYEYRGNLESEYDVGISNWDIVKVDSPETVSYEYSDLSEFRKDDYISRPLSYDVPLELMSPTKDYNGYSLIRVPEIAIPCGLEGGSTSYPVEEPVSSVSNGVSCEYIEDVIPQFGASSSGWEIVKVDSPEIISYQCSGSQEFRQESYTVYALPNDISPESMPPTKGCSPDLDDSSINNSSDHQMARQTSSNDRTEVPETDNDDSLQCLENINEGSTCSHESRTAHGWPLNSAISPSSDDGLYWSSSCLNLTRHSVPVSGGSSSAGKESQLPASMATNDNASDKPMTSPGHPDYDQRNQQNHPERLLSYRKAISPTSQERLCRAMELTGLDEDEHQQCRGKLYFGKQTIHRMLKAQGLDQLGRDGATIKPKPFMRRAKQDKKGSPPKGILKVHPSRTAPHVSSACTTLQRCSQSAIAFTQRQMRDIESLATKLTTELKSMKDIVLGQLQPELDTTAATENADEVRIAVESATKAEETARKWLSMMARDCNRFCKIMKLTEDSDTAASERVIQKERKITFADEAGGKLCHIKVFKDDMDSSNTASLLQCGTVKTEISG
ncbi:Endoribonuclease Dicer-like protein [Gossypium australe]|uniref:Endoribonuclease Dicer-like protein n=1 Tax=Gossypium australe TaxID=47621 RepID=A0A5B6W411_9ROSI|nr:Endoribonuclease Dicer-like protein [Gossypium australe]